MASPSEKDAPTRQVQWPRFLIEGAVIVASILLAFGIEAWWSEGQDREAERVALEALLNDLADEVEDLSRYESSLAQQVRSSHRLAVHFAGGPSLPLDSLVTHLSLVDGTYRWGVDATAFTSLRDSGQLDLVSDPTLRQALIEHFDGLLVYIDGLADRLEVAVNDFERASLSDIAPVPLDFGDTSGGYQLVLLRPLDQIPTHPDFRALLGVIGQRAGGLASRVPDAVAQVEHLQDLARSHLESL